MSDFGELDIIAEFANMASQYECIITISYSGDGSNYTVQIDGDTLYAEKNGDNLEKTIIAAIEAIDRQSLVQQQNSTDARESSS